MLVALLSVGCGAKTGLSVPDAEVEEDAGVDAEVPEDAEVPCIEIPFDAGTVEVPLSTQAELKQADVLFLIDTTLSMGDEIDRIRARLRDRIAPAIESEIPDAQFGVATFADFPVDDYGDPGDRPFEMRLPMTSDLSRVQAAMNGIDLNNGGDGPESQVEALYQAATGEGLGGYIPASFGCPTGGVGYPCYRDGSLPLILLFTDAEFHNGPGGNEPYFGISPAPHTYAQTIDALQRLDVRVIGFNSGDGAAARDLRRLSLDTRAVSSSGSALVFDIGARGERLDNSVVDAMKNFAEGVVLDIDVVLLDPVPGDGIDPTTFVERVVPVRATPMDGIEGIDVDAGAFRGVVSGTTVVFELVVSNGAVVPGPEPQRVPLEVVFRGDARTRLGSALVTLVIPGADGAGCEDPAAAEVSR